MDSHHALRDAPRTSPGLPGPSTTLSTRALPNRPGRLDGCLCSLLPHQWQASPPPQGWPPSLASRGRIGFANAGLTSSLSRFVIVRPAAYARPDRSVSRRRLPFDAGPELHAERAIHMADSFQSARVARVTLAHQRAPRSQRDRQLDCLDTGGTGSRVASTLGSRSRASMNSTGPKRSTTMPPAMTSERNDRTGCAV